MPRPVPDYEGEVVRAARANMAEVIPMLDVRDKDLLEKIDNFSERFGFDPAEVEKKIRLDQMFLARFAKDPGKQGIHEKLAAKFIESLPGVKNFKVLGKNSMVVLRGAVVPRRTIRASGASRTAKTLDFEWEICGKKIYASHKYTGLLRGGGAQHNQYEDVAKFIEEANPSNLRNTLFLAIVDGDYYKGNDTGAGTTRLGALQRLANGRNVFALSSHELESFLEKLCSNP